MYPQPFNASPSAEQTIACLAFFERWETRQDEQAFQLFRRVQRDAPNFLAFQRIAPLHSPERSLFERFLDSFEEAGRLIQDEQMRADLFFENWYELPAAWQRAFPYITVLREESRDPQRYHHFEWIAQLATTYWENRAHLQGHHQPLGDKEPTDEERAIFAAFNRHTFPIPDHPAWTLYARLQEQPATYEAFAHMILGDDETFVDFDWLMCMYERAGSFIKNGIIHPACVFATWPSPTKVWQTTQPWVQWLREERQSTHLNENAEWLAEFESTWHHN
jgi:hypothetical protein